MTAARREVPPRADCSMPTCQQSPRLDHIESWERQQNGSLVRLADEVSTTRDTLHKKIDDTTAILGKRFDRLLYWVLGAMASVVIGLVVDIATGI